MKISKQGSQLYTLEDENFIHTIQLGERFRFQAEKMICKKRKIKATKKTYEENYKKLAKFCASEFLRNLTMEVEMQKLEDFINSKGDVDEFQFLQGDTTDGYPEMQSEVTA